MHVAQNRNQARRAEVDRSTWGSTIDTSKLTWREKMQILDITARIVIIMLLAGMLLSSIITVVFAR